MHACTAVGACATDLIERYVSPFPEAAYNYVQQWDYSMLAQGMCGRGGKSKVYKVRQGHVYSCFCKSSCYPPPPACALHEDNIMHSPSCMHLRCIHCCQLFTMAVPLNSRGQVHVGVDGFPTAADKRGALCQSGFTKLPLRVCGAAASHSVLI